MLSGETGVGEYPVHTVETMARIIQATENHALEQHEVGTLRALPWDPHTKSGVIAKAAGEVAERIEAKYVVAFTQSGDSARRMSRLRGPIPVLAFTPEAQTRSQLVAVVGRRDVQDRHRSSTPTRWSRQVDEQLLNIGRVEEGDLVVIIAGSPPGIPGSTNALRVHRMGDAINEVAPAYRRATGEPVAEPAARDGRRAPGGIRTHTGWGLRPHRLCRWTTGAVRPTRLPDAQGPRPPLAKVE